MTRLILASQSPRRKDLLAKLGVAFEVQSADVDESSVKGETPLAYCRRVAKAKAEKIHQQNPDAIVIAADTPVVAGRRILQSAHTREEAEEMMRIQSGRKVQVPTAVCVITPDGKILEDMAKSWVKFKPLTKPEIERHLADKDNWYGVSGAFKIQDSTVETMIKQVQGSVTGIVGLPLYQTAKLLRRAGLDV
ncbi:MAG: Maf family protein [Alphaproteobacteria bacterium]|nr:Maf family protein [Alphaproteobacteria bacterium]MDD9919258.1 Maf family protein [Alphaproteobacteria bacterium]